MKKLVLLPLLWWLLTAASCASSPPLGACAPQTVEVPVYQTLDLPRHWLIPPAAPEFPQTDTFTDAEFGQQASALAVVFGQCTRQIDWLRARIDQDNATVPARNAESRKRMLEGLEDAQ